ncbi:MAG TPA: DUF1918 domain-containing protein [Nocardioidaceae bacterium]
MHASVGDLIHVSGTHVSDHERDGKILEVRGKDGTPPYVVRWFDTGHEALVFPGPDATIRHEGSGGDRPA